MLAVICPRRYTVGGCWGRRKGKARGQPYSRTQSRGHSRRDYAFAKKLGLDPHAFLDVARNSAAYSQVMDVKGKKMVDRDYVAYGKVVQTMKDFTIIREYAREAGQALPFAEVYIEMLQGCIQAGEGDWDTAAIIESIRRQALPSNKKDPSSVQAI